MRSPSGLLTVLTSSIIGVCAVRTAVRATMPSPSRAVRIAALDPEHDAAVSIPVDARRRSGYVVTCGRG